MEISQLEQQFFIHSSASFAEIPTHVLKESDTFAIFDQRGDFTPTGNREQGLFHRGTRFLSHFTLRMMGHPGTLLQSSVRRDNTLLTVDLTNPDCPVGDGKEIVHGTLHLFRAKMLFHGALHEHVRLRSYADHPIDVDITLRADTDFADIFEVRGTQRERKGERLPTEDSQTGFVLGYRGLDDVVRRTHVRFSPDPDRCSDGTVSYRVRLDPKEDFDLYIEVACEEEGAPEAERLSYDDAKSRFRTKMERRRERSCVITTSNQQFDAWLNRSLADLNMLLTRVPGGLYPYAGIPWYSTVFGRDGLLTALMSLWINPEIARGTLAHLAALQADEVDAARDAQPGKILHEARFGELAATGEVPFARYYGSVDSTPLFVMLAGAYYTHTGDRRFIEEIWPNIERALAWIDEYGDVDGDGFIEYARMTESGLAQQGWKDSFDSIFHADGIMARAPIALCEAQAYVYDAKRRAADLADVLGKRDVAASLREDAQRLYERFQEAFWLGDLGTYAMALDGDKEPCRVRSSNAGHALTCGIVPRDRAHRLVETLFAEDSFCGWGIRTLSSLERRYNPMSYHNGSMWPHDNAVIGAGLGRYGFKREVHRLLEVLFEASLYDSIQRLPELYCGFTRQPGEGPTRYPVACSPQAWATVVAFQLLQAALGLEVHAAESRVVLRQPLLPEFLEQVTIRELKVGDSCVDLSCQRYAENVGVEVTRCEGADVQVEIFV